MSENRIPLGPFELERRIGSGGMGEVWKGRHITAGIPVAVKVLTHDKHKEEVYYEAFQNEVRAVAGLDHRGIVRVLDYGEVDAIAAQAAGDVLSLGSPYIVMEYAERGSLVRFQRSLGWAEFKVVLFAVLDALAHAHACGVLHRDLKPANILVGCGPADPGIKLTDFGLAHAIDADEPDELTRRGWGTPQYMSPEQFRGAWREFGPWTDLYSLGVMAFELVTGGHPFEATTGTGFVRAHALLDPQPMVPRFAIPIGFDDWIHTLLQKQPDARFRRAADAAFALQRLGDPEGDVKTFTVMPAVGGVASDSETLDPDEESRQENDEENDEGIMGSGRVRVVEHDADTLAEQVASTRLLHSQPPVNVTQSLAVEDWGKSDLTPDSILDRSQGRIRRSAPPLPWTWRRPSEHRPDRALLGAGLGIFGIARVPLVDREPERDAMWEALKSVRENRSPRAVILTGPAGTGKSRLAQWLSTRAHEVGSAETLRALHGPMAPSGDALRRMLHVHFRTFGLEPEKLVDVVRRAIEHDSADPTAEANAIADFLSHGGSETSSTANYQTPRERHGLLRRQLARLGRQRPVVLWLDDVQWGADSLNLVLSILEDESLPVLVVMTARDSELQARTLEHALIRKLAADDRVRVLRLQPLVQEDADELVRKLLYLEGDLADEVVRRSGGNPLFAVQIVDEWVEQGKLVVGLEGFELAPGASVEIPDDIFQIWEERLENLLRGPEERVLLEVGAALGQRVDTHEWRDACRSYGTSVATEFMQRMMWAGLLEVEDRGWSFAHGMLRETLVKTARNSGRWPGIHLACADMLEKRYGRGDFSITERRAMHLVEADRLGNAIEPLLDAARYRLARSEFERAGQLLQMRHDSLLKIGVDPNRPSWGEGALVRAELHLQQGNLQTAHAMGQQLSRDASRHGWNDLLARSYLVRGDAERHAGRLNAAKALFENARECFTQSGDDFHEARSVEGLARVAHLRGELDEAVTLFGQALQAFDDLGETVAAARCINGLGDVARRAGQFERARTLAIDAMELAEATNNPMGIADSLDDIAELERWMGNYERATEFGERALRIYESIGSQRAMGVRLNLGQAIVELGRIAEARELFERARVFAAAVRDDSMLARASVAILGPLAFLGQWDVWDRRVSEFQSLRERLSLSDPNVTAAAEFAIGMARRAGQDERAKALETITADGTHTT